MKDYEVGPVGPIALRAAADAETPEVLSIREEGGNNRGKWVAAILAAVHLAVGNPWCTAFVILRLKKAAAALGLTLPADLPITGYTPTFANWAKAKGLWISVADAKTNPQKFVSRGDLVFFWGKVGSVWRIRHVGIMTAVHDWGVETVEGNTGDDGGRDGDGVYRKRREWDELGSGGGFVRLPF